MNVEKATVDFLKKYNAKNYNYFCSLRFTHSVRENENIFNVIKDNSYTKEKLRKMYFPSSQEMLGRRLKYNPQISLEDIVRWDQFVFMHFTKELNDYLTLKYQYEKEFIKENYFQAWMILCTIEKECGCSLWLIEQQFGVLHCMKEEQEAKKLLNHYKKIAGNFLTKNILSYMYWRKDPAISCEEYVNYLEKLLQSYGERTRSVDYLKCRLSIYGEKKLTLYSLQLQLDETFSLIDLYETVVDALFFLMYRNKELVDIGFLKQMQESVMDSRWNSMLVYKTAERNIRSECKKEKLVNEILEQYGACNWLNAERMMETYLKEYPEDFVINYLYVKCMLFQNKELKESIGLLHSLYNLYTMPVDLIPSKIEFNTFLKKYYGTSWQYKVLAIIERKIDGKEEGVMDYMAVCYDGCITPLFCKILHRQDRGRFLNSMKEVCPIMTKMLAVQYGVCDEQLSIDSIMKGYYVQICSLRLKVDYIDLVKTGQEALKYLESGEISMDHAAYYYYMERICRQLFPALLKSEFIREAVELYGQMLIERSMLVKRLDVEKLVQMMEEICSDDDSDISFMSTIYAPIVYHCWYGNECSDKVILAYRNFLYLNKAIRITDWMKQITNISQAEIYFLFNVCTEGLFERDYFTLDDFSTAADIRIYVLRFLAERDQMHSKRYMEELNAIYSRQKLEESVNLLNRNRIHIETDKLYAEMEGFLKKEFEQYNLYRKLWKEVDVALKEDIDSKTEDDQIFQRSNELMRYQSENIFYLYIIKKITGSYLSSRQYGLNTYLGTRIRHNYCQQYLLSVFERWELLSKKEKDNSVDYVINEYWNKYHNESIFLVLNKFSRSMNEVLQVIKNEWIQIKSEEKKEGLFDYDHIAEEILNYTLIVRNSYEIVYYTTIGEMNKKTVSLLESIREKLGDELKKIFEEHLCNLEKDIQSKKNNLSREMMEDISFKIQKCREELPNTIESFQDIFYFENVSYPDFSMDKVIDCYLTIFQKLYPDKRDNILIRKIEVGKQMRGSFFPDWIDIIGILFQNAKEHSGYRYFQRADFCIAIHYKETEREKWMILETSNKVKKSIEKQKEMDSEVAKCVENIHRNKFLEESIKEQGSGLYKIARIIKYNFGVETDYEAGVNNGLFHLKLKLQVRSMERE